MNKLVTFTIVFALLALVQLSIADPYFQRQPTSEKSMEKFEGIISFKCIPGRTIIKFEEKREQLVEKQDSNEIGDDFERRVLRSHMNFLNYGPKDESCKICVCSAEGKDEYCSRRPAVNVNECLRMNNIMEEFKKNIPFSHDRDLSQMIRRDYIWHRDEIPYQSDAQCYRGTSFYSNNPKANSTDISQQGSDLDSLLSYTNKSICYFCICSTSGNEIACIIRDPYFCDYFRMLGRDDEAARDLYTNEFGQDRPAYFRLLSQRMRRTLDEGVYDLIETAGSKITGECVPYVSEYTDCNKENQCMGCTRCTCSPEGTWVCKKVRECPREYDSVDESSVDNAFNSLLHEFGSKSVESSPEQTSPPKEKHVLVPVKKDELDLEGEILALIRKKRSLSSKDLDEKKANGSNIEKNNTIIFYHTVDELNEDTLANSNITGTLEAKKVEVNLPSRRSHALSKDNATFDNSLQIEYSKPQNYHQVIDNKIDGNHSEYGFDLLEQEKLGIVVNRTQQEKDKDLSKIIVNELKVGSEFIGDKNAPVMSNITFTPENDTLTAMAFIAGNLLNKLWDMEKEASDESLELETIKNEKLQDLLELFKEPLTMRQETFLKNALESLSKALDKHKDIKNISICESLNEAKKFVEEAENMKWERSEIIVPDKARKNSDLSINPSETPVKPKNNAAAKAVSKIHDVLNLMKKYELTQKHLNDLKNMKGKKSKEFSSKQVVRTGDYSVENISGNGTDSLNSFGKILEKISKLLLPYKTSRKLSHKIKNMNMFVKNKDVLKNRIKNIFNIDIGNTTLSIKDKIILDYLIKMKKNPRSLFDDDDSGELLSSHSEKDILLNLSEFFKMKSLVDLVKMIGEDNTSLQNRFSIRSGDDSTNRPSTSLTETVIVTTDSYNQQHTAKSNIEQFEASVTASPKKFANTKERFKAHLKTILDDLVELHRESGAPGKDLELANALPCIYNILKDGDIFNTSSPSIDPYKKLSQVFEELKQEYQTASTAVTRRMDRKEFRRMLQDTPKSAFVWERIVKNVDKQQKQNARRNSDIKAPIPLQDLLKKIEKLEEISSSYSDIVLRKTLNPTERLIMIKAFHAEEQRNLDSLKDIKASIDLILTLPKEQQEEITDFVYKVANKGKFHSKVVNYIEQNKKKTQIIKPITQISDEMSKIESKIGQKSAKLILEQKEKKTVEPKEENKKNKNLHLTREDVVNQLIRNRVTAYLKTIQGKAEYRNDPNYNIAKSILLNLDSGNVSLAKQLYKIFVTSKKQNSQNAVNDRTLTDKIMINDKLINEKLNHGKSLIPALAPAAPMIPDIMAQMRRQSILDKEPLIQFEDPRYYASNRFLSSRRDQMLRNMLEAKNLKFI